MKLSVAVVAPVMFAKVLPPSVLSCHCTVATGLALAAAVNVAVWPAVCVWFAGCVVICATYCTVSVAALVVAVPFALVKIARYSYWFCVKLVVKLSVVLVAPAMLLKLVPPLVLSCHCTVAPGSALAAAVKVAVWPAVTVVAAGGVVICGANCTVSVAALVGVAPIELVKTARY